MSEDSDYTSDINYPVGQHPNSSVSQFLGVATQMSTPQRSLETSRENSYERDDGVQYGGEAGYGESYDRGMADDFYSYTLEHNKKNEGHKPSVADEDLFYNSRPNNRKDYRCSWFECCVPVLYLPSLFLLPFLPCSFFPLLSLCLLAPWPLTLEAFFLASLVLKVCLVTLNSDFLEFLSIILYQ